MENLQSSLTRHERLLAHRTAQLDIERERTKALKTLVGALGPVVPVLMFAVDGQRAMGVESVLLSAHIPPDLIVALHAAYSSAEIALDDHLAPQMTSFLTGRGAGSTVCSNCRQESVCVEGIWRCPATSPCSLADWLEL